MLGLAIANILGGGSGGVGVGSSFTRDGVITKLRNMGGSGAIFGRASDSGFHFRDRAMTQPWVPGVDLEQQILSSIPLSAVASGVRPWSLGPDLRSSGTVGLAGTATAATYNTTTGEGTAVRVDGANQSFVSIVTTATKSYYVAVIVISGSLLVRNSGPGGATFATLATSTGIQSVTVSPTSSIALASAGGTVSFRLITVQEVIYDWSWLGANLVTNGDFSSGTGWSPEAGWSISGGVATATAAAAFNALQQGTFPFAAGKTYRVTLKVSSVSAGGVRINFAGGTQVSSTTFTAVGTFTEVLAAQSGNNTLRIQAGASGFTVAVDDIVVQEIPGYPMVAPTAGGVRPTARVNLLQRTEEFDNAAWGKFDSSISANATTAPNGALTADKFVEGTGSTVHRLNQANTIVAGTTYVFGLYAKAAERTRVMLRTNNGSADADTVFDLQNGTVVSGAGTIQNVGNGWYVIARSFTAASSTTSSFIAQALLVNSGTTTSYTGDGASGIFVWGADLRLSIYTGAAYPAYQRVGDGTAGVFDYDATGFPVWIGAAATNAGLHSVGTVDMTATDALRVGVVTVKTSDATAGMLSEFSPGISTNNGAAYLIAPSSTGLANFQVAGKGTVANSSTFDITAPCIAAVSGYSDISAAQLLIAVNAGTSGGGGKNQGTGNYGNYRYYNFGRSLDSGPSLPFTGRMATVAAHIVDANIITEQEFAEGVIKPDAAEVGLSY
jgi:hypothetical protein